ncbi:TonB-dependent receptor [Tunturiibacter lichenicola]|uniref:TonB-dependent receptor n=1 Tax=Tunturiibacter lichenicola TaxID=2051959 RepID=UPI0021B2F246|nr:carboxypeptidase-like regulatory domain-containing protein [Edaphobacter lichenicola]
MNAFTTKYTWIANVRYAILICIAACLLVAQGKAQTAGTGSIQGAVTDSTGAVIPGASVTATNVATQVKHSAVTGSNGSYSFPNLDIGTYTVGITAPGFERYEQTNIVLEVGSSIAVNVGMTVGATDQKVEVQASGLALQTEDSSFKQTIDQKTITELPLNGRQVTSLITLSGGSVNANENNDQQGSKTFFSSAVISVGGGQGNATDYRLDGGDHNDYMTNVNLPFPFPDAVAQFSVETTALGAQSGLHPGGLVNVVTRSGSNDWHGTAFEFIRNNFIDATNFFSTAKDTLHQNQFGGTFGGRVIKDKLFFFAGYQRLKADQSQALTTAYVPTAANLLGDFSATESAACQSNGKAIQLVNPKTGAILPNNQIDPSNFSASALALQKLLPAATNDCGLVTYAIPNLVEENQFITRIDATINAKNSLYGRYFLDGYQSPAYFSNANLLITTQPGNYERAQALTIGETYIINSQMVNSFHATGTRRRDDRGPAGTGVNASTIGVDIYAPIPVGLQVTATNKWGTYCGTCAVAHFNDNTFSFADDVNWVRGKHQLAFGGEYVRSQLNISNAYESNGTFTFSGVYGQKGPAGTSPGTGADANLDFLTGSMSAFQQSKAQQNALRAPIPSLYIQDTFHPTKTLVLSAGVRWDPFYFPTDFFGRGSIFSMSGFENNIFSTVFPNAPAGSFFYGDTGVPKAFTKNSPWQFSPRVGATLDPFGTGKTVFRVGGALVYDEPNFFTGQRTNQNPPFAQTISNNPVNAPLSFDSPWSNGTQTTNPFPQPFKPTAATVFPSGGQYIVLTSQFHAPYTMQWTASVQQEFGRGWEFQIDYIGNRTDFNPYGFPIDPATYIPGTCGTGPCSTIGNTASRYSLTLANKLQGPKYLGGGAGSILIKPGANASYNGMITTIQHRVSSNFVFLANYTWSHCIDISDNSADVAGTTVQNPFNIKGDQASCGFDYRAVFNTTVVASSHFSLTGWKGYALNNWQIAPLIHITDGTPFNVTSGVDNSLTAVNNDRPNLVNPIGVYTHAKIRSGRSTNAQFINLSAFTANPTGTFGNSGRNAYRGPEFLQVDSALSRVFPLHDRLALNLRFEGFNVLNHPNFAAPGSTAGYAGSSTSIVSSTFGQVTSTVNGYGARIFQGAVKLTF